MFRYFPPNQSILNCIDYLSGPLDAPSNLSVNISNTSNTTFLLSWGAPFSFDVTDTVEIYYYTLCTNIYGCKNISSDSNCTFPRTCTSSVDFTDPSLNGTNGGQNKTIMDHGAPIEFSLFAVNGAGKGNVSEPFRFKKESGLCISAILLCCCSKLFLPPGFFYSVYSIMCLLIGMRFSRF